MDKVKECLGLFNSMILGHENHTEKSKQVFTDAKLEIKQTEQLKILFAYELGILSQMQAMKLLNLSIVDFRDLYFKTQFELGREFETEND